MESCSSSWFTILQLLHVKKIYKNIYKVIPVFFSFLLNQTKRITKNLDNNYREMQIKIDNNKIKNVASA